jgi:hypothetical protein
LTANTQDELNAKKQKILPTIVSHTNEQLDAANNSRDNRRSERTNRGRTRENDFHYY